MKILSIDGGGIRGIIPGMFLEAIEQKTGKRIAEMFDLITGTSTGGILALGLAKPGANGKPEYAASDLVELYEMKGKEIFSRSLWHRMASLGNLRDEKYPSKGVNMVLREYFGDARLKDSLKDVLVTSYAIERRMPFFFRSQRAREQVGYDFPMRLVARATSAAPTYFEPLKLPANDGGSDYYALVDGGVFANNPAMCGYAEAVSLGKNPEELLVVSLGTGEYTKPIPYSKAKDWGVAGWAVPILNVVFDGVSDTVNYQMKHLLPERNGRQRYYRFQVNLPEKNDEMDDVSEDNLRELRLLAEAAIEDNAEAMNNLCRQLKPSAPAGIPTG